MHAGFLLKDEGHAALFALALLVALLSSILPSSLPSAVADSPSEAGEEELRNSHHRTGTIKRHQTCSSHRCRYPDRIHT
jgi:hypothetical protein